MSDVVRDAIAAGIAALTQTGTRPTTTDGSYGQDLVCYDDIDPKMRTTTGIESLAQDVYHRATTTRGTVADDPDFGENVIEWLHRPSTSIELQTMAGQLESEIGKDDRVATVTVTVAPQGRNGLLVTIRVEPEDPSLVTFSLIVIVTDGAALLKEINT